MKGLQHGSSAPSATMPVTPFNPSAGKWDRYYAGPPGTAPFDSTRPSSQLINYLCSCIQDRLCRNERPLDTKALVDVASTAAMCLPPQLEEVGQQTPHSCQHCCAYKPAVGGRVLELGCGTGASSRWLAHHGYQVTAVDISAAALQAAAAAAAAEGLPADNPQWLLRDIFELPTVAAHQQGAAPGESGEGSASDAMPGPDAAVDHRYNFIYDCQVYHVLVRDQAQHSKRLPQLLHDLLVPGGLLMILAGNANEPEVGPNVLSADELLQPLLSVGFELVLLHQTRFDSTEHYLNVLGMRPLAWWVVLQRPQ